MQGKISKIVHKKKGKCININFFGNLCIKIAKKSLHIGRKDYNREHVKKFRGILQIGRKKKNAGGNGYD